MTVRISAVAAIVACNALNRLLDMKDTPGKMIVFEGARPAGVDVAISTQKALVTFDLPNPAFANAVDTTNGAHATAGPITPVKAAQTGKADFFRVFDGDGVAVFDGSVTDTTGNGDLKLSSTAVIKDIDVTVVSLTTNMPKGA